MRCTLCAASDGQGDPHHLGGGCPEMLMNRAVDETVRKANRKKAIAVEPFAHVLRQIPTILAHRAQLR